MAFSPEQRAKVIRGLRLMASRQPGLSTETRKEARRLAGIAEKLAAVNTKAANQPLRNTMADTRTPQQIAQETAADERARLSEFQAQLPEGWTIGQQPGASYVLTDPLGATVPVSTAFPTAEDFGRAADIGEQMMRDNAPAYEAALRQGGSRAFTGPLSLFEFIASKGGIRDQGGELARMGVLQKFIPGLGSLARPDGMAFDRAREAAEEAGYLNQGSTIADLLERMGEEAGGWRRYCSRATWPTPAAAVTTVGTGKGAGWRAPASWGVVLAGLLLVVGSYVSHRHELDTKAAAERAAEESAELAKLATPELARSEIERRLRLRLARGDGLIFVRNAGLWSSLYVLPASVPWAVTCGFQGLRVLLGGADEYGSLSIEIVPTTLADDKCRDLAPIAGSLMASLTSAAPR